MLDAFISSTCYDLADLRAELKKYLEDRGLQVRISESVDSAFYVEPTEDSIASCLRNVEESKAILVILDRRYGPRLPVGTAYEGISATHAEVRRAQELGKPTFYFIRESALTEYQHLRRDPAFKTHWVDQKSAADWTAWVNELFSLPAHADRSNWYDTFRFSTDLKHIVFTRIVSRFPEYAGTKAMHPDRLVRVTYTFTSGDATVINGTFRNLGIGPAVRVRFGVCRGAAAFGGGTEGEMQSLGGLMEGETTARIGGNHFNTYFLRDLPGPFKLYCEYYNRFGDRYRVEVPLGKTPQSGWRPEGEENIFVWFQNGAFGDWVKQEG